MGTITNEVINVCPHLVSEMSDCRKYEDGVILYWNFGELCGGKKNGMKFCAHSFDNQDA